MARVTHTLEVTRAAFRKEIAAGRVTVLTKPNSGKADALDYGLEQVTEEVFVGIDADTIIAPDAISKLVPHFSNPKVGAMAGNAKVGNRVESVDALAGAGIHHQPELRTARTEYAERRQRRTGSDWRMAHDRPCARPAAIITTPSPKMPISRWRCCRPAIG